MQITSSTAFIHLPDGVLYYQFNETPGWKPSLDDLCIREKVLDEEDAENREDGFNYREFIRFEARRFFDYWGRPIGEGNFRNNYGNEIRVHKRTDLFAVYSREDTALISSRFHVDVGTAKNPCEYELNRLVVEGIALQIPDKLKAEAL